MRVGVYGLWHLGCVTAACVAEAGHDVIGIDPDAETVADLERGTLPIHEPGLQELTDANRQTGRLRFVNVDSPELKNSELLWVTFDTPVNDDDEADVDAVWRALAKIEPYIPEGILVLVSSQVPVGFTRELARRWAAKNVRVAISPENLRLGKAIDVFMHSERVVVGLQHPGDRVVIEELFGDYAKQIEWMSIESAEMTKHALNAFLANSVTFINEIARICEAVGANAKEVERGLKSEARIGPKAYLAPGVAYAGGTLARDVRFLVDIGRANVVDTPLFQGVMASNNSHKGWLRAQVAKVLKPLRTADTVVAVLGLTYKPGTNTLRRSSAVELCQWLHEQGVTVKGYDPAIEELPEELAKVIELQQRMGDAIAGADLVVVATEWPLFRELTSADCIAKMRTPNVIDPNHFLAKTMHADGAIRYFATGRAA